MVVFSFRSVVRLALYDVLASSLSSCRFLPVSLSLSPPSFPRPRRCPICNHAHVAPRCRHSVSYAADIIARPDARRGSSSRVAPANHITIGNSLRKEKNKRRRSPFQAFFRYPETRDVASCALYARASNSLSLSLSLSFFLSFFPRQGLCSRFLDLENLRSVWFCAVVLRKENNNNWEEIGRNI